MVMVQNIKNIIIRIAIALALGLFLVFGSTGAKATPFNSDGYDLHHCTVQGHIHIPKTGATDMQFDRVDSCNINTKVDANSLAIITKTGSVLAIFPHRLPQGRYTFVYVWGAKTAWVNDMVMQIKFIPIPLAQ